MGSLKQALQCLKWTQERAHSQQECYRKLEGAIAAIPPKALTRSQWDILMHALQQLPEDFGKYWDGPADL